MTTLTKIRTIATPEQQIRFLQICALPALSYAQLKCVGEQKVRDIRNGKSRLAKTEWDAFQAEIDRLRYSLSIYLVRDQNQIAFFVNVIHDKIVKHHALLPGKYGKSVYERIRQGIVLKEDDMTILHEAVQVFYDDLKI